MPPASVMFCGVPIVTVPYFAESWKVPAITPVFLTVTLTVTDWPIVVELLAIDVVTETMTMFGSPGVTMIFSI